MSHARDSGGIGGPVSLATTGVTFLPLKTVSDRASELIETAERAIASKADTLPAGLKEQYAAQLALHKSETVPTVEFIVFPFNPHPTGSSLCSSRRAAQCSDRDR